MSPKRTIPVIISLVILCLLLPSCARKKVKRVRIDPNFGNYISAYTSGHISKKAVIRVVLTNDCPVAKEYTEICEEKYFSFDPAIKGKTRWVNKHTLEFTPDDAFEAGRI